MLSHRRSLALTATGVAGVLVLSACGTGGSMGQMGHSSSSSSTAGGDSKSRDVMFAQMMIPHHQQAVEMADVALESRSASAALTDLARQIKAAQDPEIETMNRWLREWNAPAPSSMDHGSGGQGMMTDEDMKTLGAQAGSAFDRMWLTMMVEHHEDAVAMAQDVLTTTRNAEVKGMAEAIVEGQEKEIATMQELLAPDGRSTTAQGLPSSHVHGVGRDPGTGSLLLATHDGLFQYGATGPKRVGPVIDLMGFTIAGRDHYYASGHPGPGVDLPQPVGLIESRDGGKNWTRLSRGGQSDFHALTHAAGTVIGFDGQLRRTSDGRTWTTASISAPPRVLAADPRGERVLATTEAGLQQSTDRGQSWSKVPAAPLLLLVAWADESMVAGVAPDGAVSISRDAGRTWQTTGRLASAPQALSAGTSAGRLEILVATDDGVVASSDGSTFTAAPVAR